MTVVDTVVCALTHPGMVLASRSINDIPIVLNSSSY